MDEKSLETFASRFPGFSAWPGRKQTDHIAFYLTDAEKKTYITVHEIEDCFKILSLKEYSGLRVYLSKQANAVKGKYIKTANGYKIERGALESLRSEIENEPKQIEVSRQLENLSKKLKNPEYQQFLEEAMNCYRVEAFRATVIMVWNLSMHHLYTYVMDKELAAFNAALAKSPDKRVKKITKMDEFTELSESKFIQLLRTANIVTNDVRKILEEKLGIRNSAAHPSNIVIDGHKATEFTTDLINNVVFKY